MAIAAYFHPTGLTLAQYHETHRRLEAAGEATPEGRLHHSCFGEDGDLMVYDVWASPETFATFGETLMPILADIGVAVGEPIVMPIHRIDQSAVAEH